MGWDYHTGCSYRCNLVIIAIIIMDGDNILALCICDNEGCNLNFAKVIIQLNDDIQIQSSCCTGPTACGVQHQALCRQTHIPSAKKPLSPRA